MGGQGSQGSVKEQEGLPLAIASPRGLPDHPSHYALGFLQLSFKLSPHGEERRRVEKKAFQRAFTMPPKRLTACGAQRVIPACFGLLLLTNIHLYVI